MSEPSLPPEPSRRGFAKRALAAVVGAVAFVSPVVAGVVAMLDPLVRRKSGGKSGSDGGEFVRVTTLDALPVDGVPRQFPVVLESKRDAWTTYQNVRVGAVFLRRTADGVTAHNVVCPHAGCFLDYTPKIEGYRCPCHNSEFEVDGALREIASNDLPTVSPRGMDSLEIDEVALKEGVVRVKFQNFRAGVHQKTPVT